MAIAMISVMAGLTTGQTVARLTRQGEKIYLRKPDGTLQPYGHQIVANSQSQGPTPLAKPGSGSNGDTVPPTISEMKPDGTSSIGASYTFSATVTDTSGVRSVAFVVQYPDNVTTQSFSASQQSGTYTWQVSLQGFSDGNWSWWVVAKDAAPKGGNTATSNTVGFTVDTGGGSSSGGGGGSSGDTTSGTVTNAEWNGGGG